MTFKEENSKLQFAVNRGYSRIRELESAVNELSRKCNELTFKGYDL